MGRRRMMTRRRNAGVERRRRRNEEKGLCGCGDWRLISSISSSSP